MRAFSRIAVAFGSVVICSGLALGQAKLGPYVVDSNGLRVGHADFGGTNILMFFDGNPALVSAGPNGFNIQPFLRYFIDTDCATQGIIEVGSNVFFAPGYYRLDGNVHYPELDEAGDAPVLSVANVNADGSNGDCSAFNDPIHGAPELFGPVSFTAPFSVVETLPVSPAPATATFNDVPTNHPFFQYIEALHASGITGGCSASPLLYCPDNPVTRGQVAVFLAKALGL